MAAVVPMAKEEERETREERVVMAVWRMRALSAWRL